MFDGTTAASKLSLAARDALTALFVIHPTHPRGNERSRPEREEEEDESARSSVSRRLPRQHWKITLPPTRADPVVLRSSLTFLFFFLSATELDSTDFFLRNGDAFSLEEKLSSAVLCVVFH